MSDRTASREVRSFGHSMSAHVTFRDVPDRLDARGVARGAGQSYGDQAFTSGGTVWRAGKTCRMVATDVLASGGVSLRTVLAGLWPRGRTLAVLPGSLAVTVGGAIAADVHGKNHPRAGSFGNIVRSFELATPTGMHTAVPGDDVFWATVGGMGLTGVVTQARLRTIPLASTIAVHTRVRAEGLAQLLTAMQHLQDANEHVAAWVDLAGRKPRAIIEASRVADAGSTDTQDIVLPRRPRWRVPAMPVSLVSRPTIRAANAVRWRRTVDETSHVPLVKALAPLEAVGGFANVYGPLGFIQHQTVVPLDADQLLADMMHRYQRAPAPASLAVLKRLGTSGRGHLSFPSEGWTLAVDLPADPSLATMLDEIDREVAAANGRVYLAKDATMQPDIVSSMYPRLREWRAVADRMDPDHLVTSDLDRRLGLRRDSTLIASGERRSGA